MGVVSHHISRDIYTLRRREERSQREKMRQKGEEEEKGEGEEEFARTLANVRMRSFIRKKIPGGGAKWPRGVRRDDRLKNEKGEQNRV